jgi:hypothetical protein
MNHTIRTYSRITAAALMLLSATALRAQQLDKEVYVVRPYEPTLSDAVKLNFQPDNKEADFSLPAFSYSISPVRLENGYEPEAIKPAKTIATSLPKIYKSWLKVGIGNYATTLGELNISNLRSKDYAYGAYLYHKGSAGHLRLANDDKVAAGYGDNQVDLYAKRFYPRLKLSGDAYFKHRGFDYYGYNTEPYLDSVPEINPDSAKGRTFRAGFNLGLASTHTDSTHLNYQADVGYEHFWDKFKNQEDRVVVKAGANKNFDGLVGGLDVLVDYSNTRATLDTVKSTQVQISPWITKRSKDWKFLLGFDAVVDAEKITNFYFYPHANLDIIIIEKVLVPFLGISGNLQKNSYMDLSAENEFVVPGLNLKSTSSNLIVYGGLRGSISSMVRFRADVTYTVMKNMYFFVNDTLGRLQNQFTAVTDDVDLITYHGQVSVQPSTNTVITLDGKYFDYNTLAEKKAWHKPDFRLGADASFLIGSKFNLDLGFAVIGNRWVPDKLGEDGMHKIKPVADANLQLTYNYSKALSVFGSLYNITDQSYLLWNQYPSQRFNLMFGLSYKL